MDQEITKLMKALHSLCSKSKADGEFDYYHNKELEKHSGLLK